MSLLITLQDDCNEKLKEHKAHQKHEGYEVSECSLIVPTAHSLHAILNIVLVGRVIYAIIPCRFDVCEGSCRVVPRVSSLNSEEGYESVRESLKVDVVVHIPVSLHFPKIDHAYYGVDVHD